MSSSIGAVLFEVVYDKYPTMLRYLLSLIKTIYIILAERPDVLIAQNPSVFLSLFVTVIKITKTLKFTVVIDAHNVSIFPSKNTIIPLEKIRNFILRNSDITIVTTESLACIVKDYGGVPVVIEDPLPNFSSDIVKTKLKGKKNFLFVCSYADDEPYCEVISATRQLGKDICVYMTGAPKGRLPSIIAPLPENLIITGYLSEDQYISMLFSVDAVIDLTKREDCLVCGAYEAISALKPLILSEKEALKQYFGTKGIVYAKNTPDDIIRCVNDVVENLEKYKMEVPQLKSQLLQCWRKRKENFFIMLNE